MFINAGAEGAPHLNGQDLGIFWVLPFVGILLSIAIFPLVAEHFWHHNFGKISLFWALLLIIPFTFTQNEFNKFKLTTIKNVMQNGKNIGYLCR